MPNGNRITIDELVSKILSELEWLYYIYLKANTEIKRNALEAAYMEVVRQDIPVWDQDTDLLKWLEEFCRK